MVWMVAPGLDDSGLKLWNDVVVSPDRTVTVLVVTALVGMLDVVP